MTPKSRSRSPMFELEWDLVNIHSLTKLEVSVMNICQDTVLTRYFDLSFCTWWPLKVGQGHPCSNSSETLLICVHYQIWSLCDEYLSKYSVNEVFWPFFCTWWPLKVGQGHPCLNSSVDLVNMYTHQIWSFCDEYLSKYSVNEVFWPFFCTWWPLKVGQGHPCSNSSETLLICVYLPNLKFVRWIFVKIQC